MKQKLLTIGLILSLLTNAFLGVQWLESNRRMWRSRDVFDLDVMLEQRELLQDGFTSGALGDMQKRFGSAFVTYDYLKGHGVYTKRVIFPEVSDSTQLATLLKEHNAFICSPFIKSEDGSSRAFLKSRSSGLIFNGVLNSGRFVIDIDFPNTRQFDRARNRSIEEDGTVTIYDSSEHMIETISRDDYKKK